MKKYLITQAMRDAILSIPGYQNLKDEIAVIKPIEPLSDDDINLMWYEATAGRMHIKLARAIERHIIGETP